jgi:predicted metalloprotease
MTTTSTPTTEISAAPSVSRRRFARLLAAALLATMLALTVANRPADAFNPNQRTASGVLTIQAQWYGGVNDFWARTFAGWGYRYTPPGLSWYNSATGWMYQTPCGFTMRNNGFYCASNHRIYLDANYMQHLINTRGDFAAGGFIAHEWGHAIARLLGFRYSNPGGEYLADCLAGMSVRWGYATGRLVGTDYYEFRGWLASQVTSSSHGSGANRAAWYDFGYSQYNVNQCGRAVPAARSAAGAADLKVPQAGKRGP